MPVLDGRRESCSSQTNSSNCLFYKLTVTAVCLCPAAVCQYSMAEENPAAQRQTAVTAYFTSKQLLLFLFPRRSVCQYSMAEENPAAQKQTAVTAYLKSTYCCLSLYSMLNSGFEFNLAHISKRETLVLCCFNVGPASQTVGQH